MVWHSKTSTWTESFVIFFLLVFWSSQSLVVFIMIPITTWKTFKTKYKNQYKNYKNSQSYKTYSINQSQLSHIIIYFKYTKSIIEMTWGKWMHKLCKWMCRTNPIYTSTMPGTAQVAMPNPHLLTTNGKFLNISVWFPANQFTFIPFQIEPVSCHLYVTLHLLSANQQHKIPINTRPLNYLNILFRFPQFFIFIKWLFFCNPFVCNLYSNFLNRISVVCVLICLFTIPPFTHYISFY